MNKFLNNIKIPSLPQILITGEIIPNIAETANIFDDFFASQCTPLKNSCKLPSLLVNTNIWLNKVFINKDDITYNNN